MFRRTGLNEISRPLFALAGPLLVLGCTGLKSHELESSTARSPLIGLTTSALLSCAGPPQSRLQLGQGTVLRYYKEAPMLEESRVGSKGSLPGMHRGCWADLLTESGTVTGVEFRPVPDQERDSSLCHQIFEGCAQ
jgi:hypothetical protein